MLNEPTFKGKAPEPALDLAAYLERTGYAGPLDPSMKTLEGLHLAHTGSIPFENLDIQLGRPILLDLGSLQAKVVGARRGGYCFEQNSLFAAVLRALGFCVTLREARVRGGARTHLVLEVQIEGAAWLVDVGFGWEGILGPVPLDGREQARFGGRHRVAREGQRQVLQALKAEGWDELYALEPGEVFPVDLVMANHYTSTYPASKFVQTLTVQRCAPEERILLRNLVLTVEKEGRMEVRDLEAEELLPLLKARFGLEFPEGTCFRCLRP